LTLFKANNLVESEPTRVAAERATTKKTKKPLSDISSMGTTDVLGFLTPRTSYSCLTGLDSCSDFQTGNLFHIAPSKSKNERHYAKFSSSYLESNFHSSQFHRYCSPSGFRIPCTMEVIVNRLPSRRSGNVLKTSCSSKVETFKRQKTKPNAQKFGSTIKSIPGFIGVTDRDGLA